MKADSVVSPNPAVSPADGREPALRHPGPEPRSHPRLHRVDGLRGLAVLLVLVHHFVEQLLPRATGTWQAHLATGLGLSFSGVDLFFVISGFLIGGILMNQRAAPNFFAVFYARRCFRIIPLYYVFLLLCWLLARTAPGFPASLYPLGSYFGFLSNFWMAAGRQWDTSAMAVAWSLAVEEQFYLVIPLLVWVCPPRVLLGLTLAALAVTPLLRAGVLVVAQQYFQATHLVSPLRMDCLAFGVLVAIAWRQPGARAWLAARPRWPLAVALGLLPVLAWLTLRRPHGEAMPMATIGYTTLGAFYSALLLGVLGNHPRWFVRLCEARWLVFTGRISYFVYLFQGIAAWFVFRLFGRTLALASLQDVWLVAFSLTLLFGVAVVSWVIFESRFLALGQRFRYSDPSTAGG